jgi:hypothetical protein
MKTVTDYRLNKTYTTGKATIDGKFPYEILRFVKVHIDRYEYTVVAECLVNGKKFFPIKTNRLTQ